MSFLGELKRRNVFRVAGVYSVVGWLLVQVAASLEEAVGLPAWFDGFVVSLLAIGFPIALVIAWAFELTPDGIKPTTAVDADQSITAQTGTKLDIVLVVALFVFAGAILAPRFVDTDQLPELITGSSAAQASLAVLPFADMSADGDQEYFADGVSEELLNVLAKVNGLKVAGRTSSFSFKGRNEDLREIGRVLDVQHILEGSVRSQGNKIRVTAQLVQVSDGFHLWSETYDGDLSDIFAVQDEIANQILLAMKTQLNVEDAPAFAPVRRTDVTAYGLFLEARDLLYTRNPANIERARQLLDRAIEIDPAYAPAYASRAKAYMLQSDYGKRPTNDAFERAGVDVEQALALDPELADAHAVRGLLLSQLGRIDSALTSLRRAIELSPNSLDARSWLALVFAESGRTRDVVAQFSALVDVDPLYRPAVNNLIHYSRKIGDKETARRVAERSLSTTQNQHFKAVLRSRLLRIDGKLAESIKVLENAPDIANNQNDRSALRHGYYDLGIFDDYIGVAIDKNDLNPNERLMSGDFAGAIAMARSAVTAYRDNTKAFSVYANVLIKTGNDRELVEHFETEYEGSLEVYATRLAPFPPFLNLAIALRSEGAQDLYKDAMQRKRFHLDIFQAGGDVSSWLNLQEARYWSVFGDTGKALSFLDQAFAKVLPLPVFEFAQRDYDSIRKEARFLALREANLERINEERKILGYAPLTTAFYDRYASMR